MSKTSARPSTLQAQAEMIVEQRLAALNATLSVGPVEFFCAEEDSREPTSDQYHKFIEAVTEDERRRCVAVGDEPGQLFEHGCWERAGFLLGLAYGRRLGGAR